MTVSNSETEIIVEDPSAPPAHSPAVTHTRIVDIVVSLLLLALALVMAFDNWRTGNSWDFAGPQAGYFPFYLSIILAGACIYGIVAAGRGRGGADKPFVTRDQLRRVMQVFVPTLAFCLLTQWLGLYVASFLLVAGFMWKIGRIALWKSLLTSVLFAFIMFATFDLAFDLIMPKGPLEALFGR
ncbi:MAG: tripartite tricarboxylate transporter TctB family protein [Alphaproteobacteria bacterium]|nr:tripartite tricarboxylate transporter TctB family protein [Alphaproteobacteria bacterium]